jgi:hypothetical protein
MLPSRPAGSAGHLDRISGREDEDRIKLSELFEAFHKVVDDRD